jgi:hypothetical protein
VAESNFWAVKAFGRYFHLSVSRRSQRQPQNQTHHGGFAHPARCADAASLGLGPNFRGFSSERRLPTMFIIKNHRAVSMRAPSGKVLRLPPICAGKTSHSISTRAGLQRARRKRAASARQILLSSRNESRRQSPQNKCTMQYPPAPPAETANPACRRSNGQWNQEQETEEPCCDERALGDIFPHGTPPTADCS